MERLTREEYVALPLKTYEINDFEPIIKGEILPPNKEEMTHEAFLCAVSAGGHSLHPIWGWARDEYRKWTQFFLRVSEGRGYGVSYPSETYRFTLCVHEKVLRPTDNPNHIRGWDPGVCRLCGMDMDVDSGD